MAVAGARPAVVTEVVLDVAEAVPYRRLAVRGDGYYRLQGAGEYLSVSTGQWVRTGWVYASSAGMFFNGQV